MACSLRIIKISLVASIALFFTMIVFNNLTDYETNWQFIKHALSMDTTFRHPNIMWRAINNPLAQRSIYGLIIAWQATVALVIWIGCIKLIANIHQTTERFHQAKTTAFIGLFMGLFLYLVGFLIIASEWFAMWQSTVWNSQMIAGLFVNVIMLVMIYLQGGEKE